MLKLNLGRLNIHLDADHVDALSDLEALATEHNAFVTARAKANSKRKPGGKKKAAVGVPNAPADRDDAEPSTDHVAYEDVGLTELDVDEELDMVLADLRDVSGRALGRLASASHRVQLPASVPIVQTPLVAPAGVSAVQEISESEAKTLAEKWLSAVANVLTLSQKSSEWFLSRSFKLTASAAMLVQRHANAFLTAATDADRGNALLRAMDSMEKCWFGGGKSTLPMKIGSFNEPNIRAAILQLGIAFFIFETGMGYL